MDSPTHGGGGAALEERPANVCISARQEDVYQLHLRSETGEIQLLLCQDDLSPDPPSQDDSVLTASQTSLPGMSRTASDPRTDDSLLTASQGSLPGVGVGRFESGLGDSLLASGGGPRVKVERVEAAALPTEDSLLDCVGSTLEGAECGAKAAEARSQSQYGQTAKVERKSEPQLSTAG